jgi:hypothetical protein
MEPNLCLGSELLGGFFIVRNRTGLDESDGEKGEKCEAYRV